MEWMILPLRRYFQFHGRSRRKEYWMYTLFLVIVSIVLGILDSALGLGGTTDAVSTVDGASATFEAFASGGILSNIFSVVTLIPSIAVGVRRLHDTDHSGWWMLGIIIPFVVGAALFAGSVAGGNAVAIAGGISILIGLILAIVLLVWYCQKGTDGPNRFGEDPLGHSTESLAETFR